MAMVLRQNRALGDCSVMHRCNRHALGRAENHAQLKYLIYSANQIMYKLIQVAGQIGGRQLT